MVKVTCSNTIDGFTGKSMRNSNSKCKRLLNVSIILVLIVQHTDLNRKNISIIFSFNLVIINIFVKEAFD